MMRLLHGEFAHGANQSQYRETGAAVMTELERQRMQEMIRRLNEASEAYYGGRDEIMSNFEWDALFDELARLEAETGVQLILDI